jgi:hypothetical protein
MVTHTHRRRQSRGRRRNTRRSRRTQRGGGWWPFGSSDLTELRSKASIEKDPIKLAEIQKDITCAEAEEKLELVKKSIKDRVANGANGSALSSTGVTNNMTRNSAGQFQSPASNANGAGYGAGISSMFGGRRKRSRSYRRR